MNAPHAIGEPEGRGCRRATGRVSRAITKLGCGGWGGDNSE
jgi:hypothetical protein